MGFRGPPLAQGGPFQIFRWIFISFAKSLSFLSFATRARSLLSHSLGMSAFDDVEPVEQDDGPQPVVPIAYPPQYVALMNIFRTADQSDLSFTRVACLALGSFRFRRTVWRGCVCPTLKREEKLPKRKKIEGLGTESTGACHARRFLQGKVFFQRSPNLWFSGVTGAMLATGALSRVAV